MTFPTIEIVSPPSGATIGPTTPLVFRYINASTTQRPLPAIQIRQNDGTAKFELIHDGDNFTPDYFGSRTLLQTNPNVYLFTVNRTNGWNGSLQYQGVQNGDAITLVPFSSDDPPTNTAHLVIAGDSNAYGNGTPDTLTDRTLLLPFPDVRITQVIGSGLMLPGNGIEFNIQDSPLAPWQTSIGSNAGLGVELALGRALFRAGRTPTRISKWASRGSSLGIEWKRSANNYYPLFTAFLDAQVIQYGPIGVMYLDLGSNDAISWATAQTWEQNADDLIDNLRARYGNFTLLIRLAHRDIAAPYIYWEIIRQQQISFVSNDDNAIILDIDPVPFGTDQIHFTSDNYCVMGYWGAAETVARLGPATSPAVTFPKFLGAGPLVTGTGQIQPLPFPLPMTSLGVVGQPVFVEYLVAASGFTSGVSKPTLVVGQEAGFVEICNKKSSVGGLDQWIVVFERRSTSRRMGIPTLADNNDQNGAQIFAFQQRSTATGSAVEASQTSANDAFGTSLSILCPSSLGLNRLVVGFVAGLAGNIALTLGAWANASLGNVQNAQYGIGSGASGNGVWIACVTGELANQGAAGTFTNTASGAQLSAAAVLVLAP